MTKRLACILVFTAVAMSSCDTQKSEPIDQSDIASDDDLRAVVEMPADTLYFGFDLRSGPKEDAAQYLPFLDYLERKTGLKFALVIPSENETVIELFRKQKVDFAAVGAASYIQAHESCGVRILVQGINSNDQSTYQSIIVARTDGGIHSVEDLRGRRMSFGDPNSTQGHIIPRVELKHLGIGLEDFASIEFQRSHKECLDAVISGEADACSLQDTMARAAAEEGLVRIVYESAFYPASGIAAAKKVPEEVIEQVTTAMLAFDPKGKDSPALYAWHKTEMPNGFSAADPKRYAKLRSHMSALGILDSRSKNVSTDEVNQ